MKLFDKYINIFHQTNNINCKNINRFFLFIVTSWNIWTHLLCQITSFIYNYYLKDLILYFKMLSIF